MKKDNLIQAPAEPDLPHSGQQSSVPTAERLWDALSHLELAIIATGIPDLVEGWGEPRHRNELGVTPKMSAGTIYRLYDAFKVANAIMNGSHRKAAADAVIEECAKIADAKAEWILSRQDGKCDTVDLNLRMMALILPDVASEMRSLKSSNPKGDENDA